MLQIGSGKLFAQAPAHHNELRGILFSNLLILGESEIETAAGKLLPTTTISGRQRQLVYEFTEFIEEDPAVGALVSHGIEPFIHDIAAVVSLGLNATCSVSVDDTFRLTAGERSTKVGSSPNSFIPVCSTER